MGSPQGHANRTENSSGQSGNLVADIPNEGVTPSLAQHQEADGPWANLSSDILAEVFSRLPFEERLGTLPLVCKAWRTTSFNPGCWILVDTAAWFDKRLEADYGWEFECEPAIEYVVKIAVDRSCGQLKELRTTRCTNAIIDYVAERCPSLLVLAMSNSLLVTDESLTNLAASCPKLKVLDVSDCYNISEQALEAVGRNCKSLDSLSRNMFHHTLAAPNRNILRRSSPIPGGDEEAIMISKHMVNLSHLEMMKTSISDEGLACLAESCINLKSLNLAGCISLSPCALDTVSAKCPHIVEFTKPITPRLYVDTPRLRLLNYNR